MDLHALVIEPDAQQRRVVRQALHSHQWKVSEAASVEEVLRVINLYSWKLVFCDADLSTQCVDSSSGVTLLGELKRFCGPAAHIVVTVGVGRPSVVLEAIFNGATDCISKPCQEAEICKHSHRVIERLEAEEEEALARSTTDIQSHASQDEYELVGKAGAILRVFRELAKSVMSNRAGDRMNAVGKHFLVTGETGTGKELVARMIHRYSLYRMGPFIPVNCSNLPAELADAELFGSSPGAFTGADRHEHQGLWEMASGGTLFLDEITEAPRSVLPKLLRVLQDGQVRRLGAKRWIKTDVQVVAATNRDLMAEVNQGRFREDVYHRLSQHRVNLPPLRERLEDVPLLATHFACLHSAGSVRLAHDALRLLTDFSCDYEWRGNVRELENVVRRAIAHAHDNVVYAVDLAPHLPAKRAQDISYLPERRSRIIAEDLAACACGGHNRGGLDERVRRFRNGVIKETLAAHNNNRSRAAKSLQVSRSKMHRLIDELETGRELR